MPNRAPKLVVEPASPGMWSGALSLALARLPVADRARRAAELVTAARRDPTALGGLFVGLHDGKLAAAAWCQELAGKSALLWGPRERNPDAKLPVTGVLGSTIEYAEQLGVQVLQAQPEQGQEANLLGRHGFDTKICLAYLAWQRHSGAEAPSERPHSRVELVSYASPLRSTLESTIEATYRGTRDAPQLNGKRHIRHVVDGYLAVAHSDTSAWWLASVEGEHVGCLLLADHMTAQAMELVYMGLVPSARGRGLGRQLVRHAQRATAEANREQLILAVDADNDPAVRVYSSLGFQPFREQTVYMRFFTA